MTVYYAVRQKNTNLFLPALTPTKRHATGVSLHELSEHPPRVFRKPSHAQQAIDWWCLGRTTRTNAFYHDGFEDDCLSTYYVPGRPQRSDMEVVEVDFQIHSISVQKELI